MNLNELRDMGAFVPTKPIKRTVKFKCPIQKPKDQWSDPNVAEYTDDFEKKEVTVHVRQGAAIDALEMLSVEERFRPFVAIHRYVVNEDGSPVFESLEQASQLATWLAIPLFESVMEATAKAPKASRRKTNGGSKQA